MKKYFIAAIFALAAVLPGRLHSQQLSEMTVVSILTCGPGDDLYSSWGHTAIRVYNPMQGFDVVFNYGTFDSSQENFFWKFLKGDLLYFQSISSFYDFRHSYRNHNRVVWEQTLNLTLEQKQRIYDKLMFDAREENRYYKYDYKSDNCTTRVVDVVNEVLPEGYKTVSQTMTFRRLMNKVLWRWELKTALNVLMGLKGDVPVTGTFYNCMPDLYMASLNQTRTPDGGPLVVLQEEVVDGTYRPSLFMFYAFPIALLALLLVYGVLRFMGSRAAGKYLTALLALTLFVTGCLGLASVFLWGVGFLLADFNINLLWIMPLNIFFLPFIFKKSRFRSIMVKCNAGLTALGLILLLAGVQGFEFQTLSLLLFVLAVYVLCWISDRETSRK